MNYNINWYRPNGLNPLKITNTIEHYIDLYVNDNDKFKQRFIDTILVNYFNQILELSLKYKNNSNILINSIWESDIFLTNFQDILDIFPDCYYVNELFDDDIIYSILKQIFLETSVITVKKPIVTYM